MKHGAFSFYELLLPVKTMSAVTEQTHNYRHCLTDKSPTSRVSVVIPQCCTRVHGNSQSGV